jgi:hypothetical protein
MPLRRKGRVAVPPSNNTYIIEVNDCGVVVAESIQEAAAAAAAAAAAIRDRHQWRRSSAHNSTVVALSLSLSLCEEHFNG